MADLVEFDSARPRRALYWADLWRFRELLLVFVQRDIAVRYRQTALGILWVVLQPLGMMLVFTLIFGRWARVDTGAVPYHLFVLSGLLPWMFFASSLGAAASSVVNAQGLISKVYFPRLIVPAAAVGAPLADAVVAFVVLSGFLLYSGVSATAAWLLMPLIMVVMALTAIGVGSFVAALIVRYRDLNHLLPYVISAWMFLTPVIYPPTLVPADWQWLLALNPVAGVVVATRAVLLGLPVDGMLLLSSVAGALLLFVLGTRYFVRQEDRFVDIL